MIFANIINIKLGGKLMIFKIQTWTAASRSSRAVKIDKFYVQAIVEI